MMTKPTTAASDPGPAAVDRTEIAGRDRLRSLALATSCAGFVLVPTLGPIVTGRGEQTGRYDTVITPPDYAFAIWAPIFLGCGIDTVRQCLPGQQHSEVARRSGWPPAGAYAANTLWSLAAQAGRFGFTPFFLPLATAFAAKAYARLQHVEPTSRQSWDTSASTGLLLGWTCLASTFNISAGTQLLGAPRDSPRAVGFSTAAILASGSVLAAVVQRSRRGFLPLTTAALWGLISTATDRRRPRRVRLGTAVSATTILGSAIARAVGRP